MEISKALKCFIGAQGRWAHASELALANGVYKAAIPATGTSDLSDESGIPFKSDLEGAFLQALASGPGVFDTLKGYTRRAGLRAPVAVSAMPLTGAIVPEGGAALVSRFSLDADALEPRKAAALAVISNTALQAPFGTENLVKELQAAAALGTDIEFIARISEGTLESGAATSDVLEDLAGLLESVVLTGNERLFWICSPGTATLLSTMRSGDDAPLLFPQMSATGGFLLGVQALVSVAAQDSLLLLDASAIVMADDNVKISLATQAPLNMIGEPESSDEEAKMISLFQADLTGVLCTRAFSARLLRPSGCAILSGIAAAWGGE